MMNALKSEWIKTKRTPIRWIIFLVPIAYAVLITWYFSFKTISIENQISIFQGFFEVWTALVVPMGAGLISGLMIHQEELAGAFNGFLGSKLPRRSLYLGKLTMLIIFITISTLLSVLVLFIGLNFVLNIPVSYPIFIMAAILAIIGALPLLALYLWISFAWGMGASIGIGGGGILIASLMATSLGDKIWQFVPWAWSVRLSSLAGAYLLYLPGMKYPPEIISSGFVLDQAIKGLIPAAIVFICLITGGLFWFKGWEGRKIYD